MKKLVTSMVLAGSLLAGACTLTPEQTAAFDAACDGANEVYAHFSAVAATGAIPAKHVNQVNYWMGQVQRTCASDRATSTAVLALAANAYLAIKAGYDAAPDAVAAVGYQKLGKLDQFKKYVQ